jgi:competence protein ComEA
MEKNKKYKLLLVILFVILTGLFYSCSITADQKEVISLENNSSDLALLPETEESTELSTSDHNDSQPAKTDIIFVHICGAVNKPGVYEVKEGTRIIQMIQLAGGLTKEAAGEYVNQAALVTDGQQVYIPTESEVVSVDPLEHIQSVSQEKNQEVKVNINTATKEELMTLAGIGEAKANSIISYRQDKGSFKSIEEIKNIEGIKDSVFNKISEFITINDK